MVNKYNCVCVVANGVCIITNGICSITGMKMIWAAALSLLQIATKTTMFMDVFNTFLTNYFSHFKQNESKRNLARGALAPLDRPTPAS